MQELKYSTTKLSKFIILLLISCIKKYYKMCIKNPTKSLNI